SSSRAARCSGSANPRPARPEPARPFSFLRPHPAHNLADNVLDAPRRAGVSWGAFPHRGRGPDHEPPRPDAAGPARPVLAAPRARALRLRADESKKERPAKPVARLVHHSGRVQGVGFRAATAQIARGYPVTGWVKNLPDGRVDLLVEGPEADVKKFLDAVRA